MTTDHYHGQVATSELHHAMWTSQYENQGMGPTVWVHLHSFYLSSLVARTGTPKTQTSVTFGTL